MLVIAFVLPSTKHRLDTTMGRRRRVKSISRIKLIDHSFLTEWTCWPAWIETEIRWSQFFDVIFQCFINSLSKSIEVLTISRSLMCIKPCSGWRRWFLYESSMISRFLHTCSQFAAEVRLVRIFFRSKQWSFKFCETCLTGGVAGKSGRSLLRSGRQLCSTVNPLILWEHDLVCVERVDYDLAFGCYVVLLWRQLIEWSVLYPWWLHQTHRPWLSTQTVSIVATCIFIHWVSLVSSSSQL